MIKLVHSAMSAPFYPLDSFTVLTEVKVVDLQTAFAFLKNLLKHCLFKSNGELPVLVTATLIKIALVVSPATILQTSEHSTTKPRDITHL